MTNKLMNVFYAVIDELYSFAMDATLRLFGRRRMTFPKGGAIELPEPQVPLASVAHSLEDTNVATEVEEEPTFRSVDEILATEPERKEQAIGGEKNTIMYAGSIEVPVYKNPTREFDSVLGKLSYGDMVMVLGEKGRWSSIVFENDTGWVEREDLVDRAAYVYPNFVIGEENNADDPNTLRVRGIIGDMFGAGVLELPLDCAEYVEYRLRRKGHKIAWPNERPRLAGRWHKILKGQPGMRIGIAPKTGAAMEYMIDEEVGHLAYVESVFPDETIKISEVGYPDSGIYNERVLTRDEWKELKPVFIQVV